MEDIAQRVWRAKTDRGELERLVRDYLPFIKKEVARPGVTALEYDDRLSLGMLVFTGCVQQYREERGAFLSYASACIRNRLIDEARRLGRGNTVPFAGDGDGQAGASPEDRAALAAYSLRQEQQDLREEIAALTQQLAAHGLSFGQLAQICPKQKRSRVLCADLARRVLQDGEMLSAFRKRGQLPQQALARQAGVSEKTIEKHRRYIVALLVILQGDYPGIGAYIPGYREVE